MERKKKEKILQIRVNEDEFNTIKRKATSCNLTTSKYLRDMALKKIINIKNIDNHSVEEKIGNLEVHLKKIENGINQLITSIDRRINQIENVIKEVYKWG